MLFRAALAASSSDVITAADVEGALTGPGTAERGRRLTHRPLSEWQDELERRYLLELASELNGNVSRMCGRLDVQRATLYARLKRLSIEPRMLRRRGK